MHAIVVALLAVGGLWAQAQLAGDAAALDKRVSALRSMPDERRGAATRQLAVEIRSLPVGAGRVAVARHLAMLSTEGDFGQEALQAAATTLAAALDAAPVNDDSPYEVLAEMERLEQVRVTLSDARYARVLARLRAQAAERGKVDFALRDLAGKEWTLSGLRGKVVLVNLWATWCPPCRKEMPDLDALARQYPNDLVILGLSDEEPAVVRKFLAEHRYRYPILLDAAGKVKAAYGVNAIPKSFIYDRAGRLVTESIDMRTMRQFKELLAQAGLR